MLTSIAGHAQESSPPKRVRGFVVGGDVETTLTDAKVQWGANGFRRFLEPGTLVERQKLTPDQAWARILEELPAQLDTAKRLGLTTILTINQRTFFKDDPKLTKVENITAFWKDERNLQTLIDRWLEVVRICADRDQDIWYDIMNEPLDRKTLPDPPTEWADWAQRMVHAIREVDKRHPIVIEPGPGSLSWGFRNFPRLEGEPIIYSFHQYQPHDYTHQGVANIQNTDLAKAFMQTQRPWPGVFGDSGGGMWDKNRLLAELKPVFEFQRANPDARIYVGEFSAIRWAPDCAQYLRDNLEIFEENGWDWTYHAFREFHGWSPEHKEDPTSATDVTKAEGITSRGAVLLEYFKRNKEEATQAAK